MCSAEVPWVGTNLGASRPVFLVTRVFSFTSLSPFLPRLPQVQIGSQWASAMSAPCDSPLAGMCDAGMREVQDWRFIFLQAPSTDVGLFPLGVGRKDFFCQITPNVEVPTCFSYYSCFLKTEVAPERMGQSLLSCKSAWSIGEAKPICTRRF